MNKYEKPEIDIIKINSTSIFTLSKDGAFETEEDYFN